MENLQSLREGLASGRLTGQKTLKLSGGQLSDGQLSDGQLSDGLSEFPLEILALADSLELLVLSDNKLRSLPPEFAQLTQLKIVFFNNNLFEAFPAVLAKCPNLSMISFKGNQLNVIPEGVLSPTVRWLILTDNNISSLPNDIGQLGKLQKLMLAGNELRSLPANMKNCQSLELIRLSANQLTTLPKWLFALPRLAWLAYAGNPFHAQLRAARSGKTDNRKPAPSVRLPLVTEDELVLEEVLGQGASGVIYKGKWRAQTVAVKRFKGDITSDGLPLDELRACLAAGSHPNLVTVLGKVKKEGEKKETIREESIRKESERKKHIDGDKDNINADESGLIFSFIPSEYHNLGGPPSLDSCTRDTYAEDVAFALSVVLNIVRGIAGAITHLHAQGITHGDLYAHNILINETGESILGDFGAASFFDTADVATGEALARLEVRAFGCLLEDLLERCHEEKDEARNERWQATYSCLQQLKADCLQKDIVARPLFTEIVKQLNLL
ncbi:MAG: leucine-rich repeat-containing protein kinase family protein [Cyanobacteria bacterium P01_D01_bin.105]